VLVTVHSEDGSGTYLLKLRLMLYHGRHKKWHDKGGEDEYGDEIKFNRVEAEIEITWGGIMIMLSRSQRTPHAHCVWAVMREMNISLRWLSTCI
jgi:hypothetical protein